MFNIYLYKMNQVIFMIIINLVINLWFLKTFLRKYENE